MKTNDVKTLRLKVSECGKALESCGVVSVTIAQLNPCGSLTPQEQREVAERITLACNHHEELVEALTYYVDAHERHKLSMPETNENDGKTWLRTLEIAKSLLTKLKG